MKIKELKRLLVYGLSQEWRNRNGSNREILDQILEGDEDADIPGTEVTAYSLKSTTIFLSDAGLAQPKYLIFFDLKSGKTFCEEIAA